MTQIVCFVFWGPEGGWVVGIVVNLDWLGRSPDPSKSFTSITKRISRSVPKYNMETIVVRGMLLKHSLCKHIMGHFYF